MSDYQRACEDGSLLAMEQDDDRFGPGPRLWDADPDVCCAAFQLGACSHTEDLTMEDIAALLADEEAENGSRTPTPAPVRFTPTLEEPF